METEHYSMSRFGECFNKEINVVTISRKAKYDFLKHSSGNEDLDEKCLHAARSMSIIIPVEMLVQLLYSIERKGHDIVLTTANGSDTYKGCVPLHLEFMMDNYGLLKQIIRYCRKNEWVDEELMHMEVKCFIDILQRLGALFCRIGNAKNLIHFVIQAPSNERKYNRKLLQVDNLARCRIALIDRHEKTGTTSWLLKILERILVRMESFTKDLISEFLPTRSATTARKSHIYTSAACTKLKHNVGDIFFSHFAQQHDFTVFEIFTKHDYEEVQNLFNDKNFHVDLINVVKPYLILSGMVACIYYALSQKHSISASKNSGSISVGLLAISCIILSSKNVILLRDSTLQKKQQLYDYLFSTLQKYCEKNNDNMIYKKKSVEMLKTIIKQCDYTRNDTYFVCPAHSINLYFDNLSNELNRVGTLRQYPADNCPSLIRLAAAGFYYTGKDREVRCFSCDASYCDWSYHSIPSEVHRRISPNCEYLNQRFPIDKTHILPNSTDDSQSSVEHCHTSHEIVYQSCKYNNIHLKINEVFYQISSQFWFSS